MGVPVYPAPNVPVKNIWGRILFGRVLGRAPREGGTTIAPNESSAPEPAILGAWLPMRFEAWNSTC